MSSNIKTLGCRVLLPALAALVLAATSPTLTVRAGVVDDCSVGRRLDNRSAGPGDYSRMWLERGLALSGDSTTVVPLAITQMLVEGMAHDALQSTPPARVRRVNRALASRGAPGPLSRVIRTVAAPRPRPSVATPAPLTLVERQGEAAVSQRRDRVKDELGGAIPGYLALMRLTAPYARITDGFYSPRPGRLHNGYDIGLDAGTPVPAGWPGKVTKMTQWYGSEYQITVTFRGVDVNYGHVTPAVKEGDTIVPGQVVGHVSYDHVDIKINVGEKYIDWGAVNPFPDMLPVAGDRISQAAERRVSTVLRHVTSTRRGNSQG